MPVLPVPQAALTQCMGVVDNQLTIIDLSWVNSGSVTPTNLNQLVNDVGTWFTDVFTPQLSSDWASTRVVGTDLSDLTGPRIDVANPATGGVSGEAAPNNVAACISFRTAQRGRSSRGRNFIPGIPNSLITLNTLADAFVSNMSIVYENLIGAGLFSAGWQWCVVSRFFQNAQRNPPLTIPITNVIFVTNKVRSMRTREVGKGV